MLLVDEMQQSLGRNPDGKHLIILHTKGSHFNYTQRYPRSFAQWKPECIGVDSGCTKAQMINSYDNSVTYVDHFISSVIDQVRRSEEHTSELQSRFDLVCRLLLEKKNNKEHRPGYRKPRPRHTQQHKHRQN